MNIFYPLEIISNWLTFFIFNLEQGSYLGNAVQFFLYDVLKIFILILIITHFVGILRYYFPIDKLRDFLVSRKLYGSDYLLSAIFGAITPFCSCSSIPLFVGFLEARIPLGVTFSFMITSPLINEVAVALFMGSFGWKLTFLYVFAGIFIGVIGGFILDKLKMEKYIEDFVYNSQREKNNKINDKSFWETLPKISQDAFRIIKNIYLYIIVGVGLGAVIHGYVPEGFFENYLGNSFWSVPVATILAVPMYSNASGAIPIIESLVNKGVPFGTALAFMMAIVGLSFPEALILKKILKKELLITFFTIVTLGIILIGYAFNFFI